MFGFRIVTSSFGCVGVARNTTLLTKRFYATHGNPNMKRQQQKNKSTLLYLSAGERSSLIILFYFITYYHFISHKEKANLK